MIDPTKMKTVTGAFHGEGDTDAHVVTEASVGPSEAEDIEASEEADARRIEQDDAEGAKG